REGCRARAGCGTAAVESRHRRGADRSAVRRCADRVLQGAGETDGARVMRAIVIVCVIAASAWAQAPGSDSDAGSGSGSGKKTIDITPDIAAPEVSAAASPSSVMLGARFTLFVTAVYGAGVEVNLREPTELGPAFEVTRRVSEDKLRSDGRHARE